MNKLILIFLLIPFISLAQDTKVMTIQDVIINTVLETASVINSPVIIQFSNGGALFNAGKSLNNFDQN